MTGRIRERIQDVRYDKHERGIYGGGRLPFGFSIEGDGKERRLERTRPSSRRSPRCMA